MLWRVALHHNLPLDFPGLFAAPFRARELFHESDRRRPNRLSLRESREADACFARGDRELRPRDRGRVLGGRRRMRELGQGGGVQNKSLLRENIE